MALFRLPQKDGMKNSDQSLLLMCAGAGKEDCG